MTRHRRSWWVFRSLSRNPLVRSVDRVEGWSVVIVVVALIGALFVASNVSDAVAASEKVAVEREAATLRSVQAVAIGPGESRVQGSATVFMARVRWFDGIESQDRTIRAPHLLKAGDRIDLWVDDQGNVRSAPRTAADAEASGVGAALLLWSAMAALAGWLLYLTRRALDRRRFREWDRALEELAGYP